MPLLQWLNYDSLVTSDRPTARYDFAMGYDWRRKFLYVFGGRTDAGQALDDIWILDIYKFTWRRIVTDVRPTARYSMVFGMDQPKNQDRDSFVVAFGAATNGSLLDDMWSFDLNREAWHKVSIVDNGPGGLVGAAGGIDSGNSDQPLSSLVVAGGKGSSSKGDDAIWVCTLSGNYVKTEYSCNWKKIPVPENPTGNYSALTFRENLRCFGHSFTVTSCLPGRVFRKWS